MSFREVYYYLHALGVFFLIKVPLARSFDQITLPGVNIDQKNRQLSLNEGDIKLTCEMSTPMILSS